MTEEQIMRFCPADYLTDEKDMSKIIMYLEGFYG
jgi:hypothetical protein